MYQHIKQFGNDGYEVKTSIVLEFDNFFLTYMCYFQISQMYNILVLKGDSHLTLIYKTNGLGIVPKYYHIPMREKLIEDCSMDVMVSQRMSEISL